MFKFTNCICLLLLIVDWFTLLKNKIFHYIVLGFRSYLDLLILKIDTAFNEAFNTFNEKCVMGINLNSLQEKVITENAFCF